jgi:hypothetical protein
MEKVGHEQFLNCDQNQIWTKFNLNKFGIWTDFEFEQILNLNKFRMWKKIFVWIKIECEQILDWSKFEFEQKLEKQVRPHESKKKGWLDQATDL